MDFYFVFKGLLVQRTNAPAGTFVADCERQASTWDFAKQMSHFACRPRVTSRFEPRSRPRKGRMIGRTTPRERLEF